MREPYHVFDFNRSESALRQENLFGVQNSIHSTHIAIYRTSSPPLPSNPLHAFFFFPILTSTLPTTHATKNTAKIPAVMVKGLRKRAEKG